ncbi:F-box protein At2g34280-like [Brachypodium distachyon]|uniref:F-box domain-containing protein n=1 Tax=Brachypodium distachyon TaxID=15368 RepID=A0A2K2DM93_BRADI|nr:F-box protein At2g34280-like [Brachypodium distachyon]PNT75390.1 hypothetical protein BRADI_1g31491v3 [Brachypodium distachyon]|eukprot:XP_014751527.1 F-box protein At2g34280-like [Brachypodium distachyon]
MAEGGAATTATTLPRDVIFDILSRTPVKSICRFRCVSKEWQSRISDRAFIAAHRSHANPEPLLVGTAHGALLLMNMDGKIVKKIKGLGVLPTFRSTLDDLICVCSTDSTTRVLDMATGKLLLTCRPMPDGGRIYAVGLGRAAASGSIKAVRLTEGLRYDGPSDQACEVLTLDDGGGASAAQCQWRPAPSPPFLACLYAFSGAGTTANGAVHFLTQNVAAARADDDDDDIPVDSVLRFDLESEQWRSTIQGPLLKGDHDGDDGAGSAWMKTGQIRLGKLGGALCMVQTEVRRAGRVYWADIWLLDDPDRSVWAKAYAIPMHLSSDIIEPLRVMPDDGVRRLLFHYFNPAVQVPWLKVYDPRDEACTEGVQMLHTSGRIGLCSLHLECFVGATTKN